MPGVGVLKEDRRLAAEVRRLTLNKIKKLFELETLTASEKELHDSVLLRLAGTVLPRLNEVTGENGIPLIVQVAQSIADKNEINAINESTGSNSQEQA